MRILILLAVLILGIGCYKPEPVKVYTLGKISYTFSSCDLERYEYELDSSVIVDYATAGHAGLENYWVDEYVRLYEQIVDSTCDGAQSDLDQFRCWFAEKHYPVMLVDGIRIPYDTTEQTYLVNLYIH